MLFDLAGANTNQDLLVWYHNISEGLEAERAEVLSCALAGRPLKDHLQTTLNLATVDEVSTYFASSVDEAKLATLLFGVAAVESRIRKDAERRATNRGNPLGVSLGRLYDSANQPYLVPFRDGILKAWKDYARDQLERIQHLSVEQYVKYIGEFSVVLDIRHWVAHGRNWTLTRDLVGMSPKRMAKTTNDLCASLNGLATLGGLTPFR